MNSIGIYGVGVMGRGLALNLASKGYRVSIYNKELHRVADVVKDSKYTLHGYDTVKDFMMSIHHPRKVLMMVPAGNPVDDVIESMSPYFDAGDVIIDGGNEWYQRTQNRQDVVRNKYGIELVGMGVSGGAYGAEHGAAFMPGGRRDAVESIIPFLRDMSDDKSHVMYVGEGGSGHFVKTVHNGIEYGIMQAIAEFYGILKNEYCLDNLAIASWFEECNTKYELNSYLIEITVQILRTFDDDGTSLVDKILDVPRMNGTGTWTAKEALDTFVPCPSIAAAIDARVVASEKVVRVRLAQYKYKCMSQTSDIYDYMHEAFVLVMHMTYLQGFQLIRAKSDQEEWDVDTRSLAQNWMGGCIIRSSILEFFAETSPIMYINRSFREYSNKVQKLALLVSTCALQGVYIPVISATYQYVLGYTTPILPANLIQAQRDCFGSHGYERIDMSGKHHTDWMSNTA